MGESGGDEIQEHSTIPRPTKNAVKRNTAEDRITRKVMKMLGHDGPGDGFSMTMEELGASRRLSPDAWDTKTEGIWIPVSEAKARKGS